MADTIDTARAKFPVKRPRSGCTCVTQRRAELKNNSREKSFIKMKVFRMKSSSLRPGRLQASRRGGSISDKQRLRCCGARPLRTVPFEPLRCVTNECLKKQGSGGSCVQPFGKQGFVGNSGKEIAHLLAYSEAPAFTAVSPSHLPTHPPPPLNEHRGTKWPCVSAKGQVKMYLALHAFHQGHLKQTRSLFFKNSLNYSASLQLLRRGAVGVFLLLLFQDTRESVLVG